MIITENLTEWDEKFQATWLAHYLETGERDFATRYKPLRNHQVSGTDGIKLADSNILFITSSGAYLPDQTPFDMDHVGDYTVRTFSANTPLSDLQFIHHSYDTTDVYADPNTLVPLDYLHEKVGGGEIGSLSPTVISFMGYQPHVKRLVQETIPAILDIALPQHPDAALLVPS